MMLRGSWGLEKSCTIAPHSRANQWSERVRELSHFATPSHRKTVRQAGEHRRIAAASRRSPRLRQKAQGRAPQPSRESPRSKDQCNFADPENRIIKSGARPEGVPPPEVSRTGPQTMGGDVGRFPVRVKSSLSSPAFDGGCSPFVLAPRVVKITGVAA